MLDPGFDDAPHPSEYEPDGWAHDMSAVVGESTDCCVRCGAVTNRRPCQIPPPPVAECGCGVRYLEGPWGELDLVGMMPDGAGGSFEIRNCVCGSTISREDGEQ